MYVIFEIEWPKLKHEGRGFNTSLGDFWNTDVKDGSQFEMFSWSLITQIAQIILLSILL